MRVAAASRMLSRIGRHRTGYGIATDRNPAESDMTEPDKEPLSRTEQLENIVDELDEKVAGEGEAEGVPGKPSDRENVEVLGSDKEPPD